jgi:hypothetical protein
MFRFLTLLLLSCTLTRLSAQQNIPDEIVAEGTARLRVNPDVIVLTISVHKQDSIERRLFQQVNQSVERLQKILNGIGFSDSAIRVAGYTVSGSDYGEKGPKMYSARNTLVLTFAVENRLMDAVYTQLQRSNLQDLEVEWQSRLSDNLEKASRRQLVQLAVENARSNAADMARALDIQLGQVKHVSKTAEGGINVKLELFKNAPPPASGATQISYNTALGKFGLEPIELEERIVIAYGIR